MWQRFLRYLSIGVINTGIHWALFLGLHGLLDLNQSVSNGAAFLAAVTFSFYANANVTFQARVTPVRYTFFVMFMGVLSFLVGAAADTWNLFPLVTLVVFSALSLVVGFLFSHYVIFRSPK